MERGVNQAKSMHQDDLVMVGGAVGAGAAILTNAPTTGVWGLMVRDNFYSSNTRTGTGIFVLTFKEFPPTILDIDATIHTVAGGNYAIAVRTYSITAKTVTIETRVAGTLTDPTTDEHIRVTIHGRESTVGSSV
jgi:hypothetical protein